MKPHRVTLDLRVRRLQAGFWIIELRRGRNWIIGPGHYASAIEALAVTARWYEVLEGQLKIGI